MGEVISFLAVGFLFGFKHAFDADHLAAVSVLNARSPDQPTGLVSKKHAFLRGIFWGLGHTVVLFALGILVLVFGLHIPQQWSSFFEFLVALMLIALGLHALWNFRRDQKNRGYQIHSHPPHGLHFHPYPSFFVGMIHGLAGSAAILVLVLSAMKSVFLGLSYLLIFGLGSMGGMALVSLFIGFGASHIKKYTGFATGIFSLSFGIALLFFPEFF